MMRVKRSTLLTSRMCI